MQCDSPTLSSVRRMALVALAAIGCVVAEGSLAAQPAQGQPQPLSIQSEVAQHGFTVHYPTGWTMAADAGVVRIVNIPEERLAAASPTSLDQTGQVFVTIEPRTSHEDAVQRVDDIRSEYAGVRTEYISVGGWPAIQRQVVVDREQSGDAGENDAGDDGHQSQQTPGAGAPQEPKEMVKPVLLPLKIVKVTTAIAAGNNLVRVEGRLPADAPPALQATIRAIGRGLTFRVAGDRAQTARDLARLQSAPPRATIKPRRSEVRTFVPPLPARLRRRAGAAPMPAPKPAPMSLLDAGLAQVVISRNISAEPEIAVSTNGQNIVIAQQSAFATSNDGGLTFPFTGFFTTTDGDSSLAFGRSGNFYEGTINNNTTGINISTNNGQGFTFLTAAFTCPATGPNTCPAGFPDQEHIAADRFNGATANGADQVYSAWRQLNGNWGIVCSANGGQAGSWSAGVWFAGDFPRIAVAQDGFVYVVFNQGTQISIHRFSDCQSGLTPTAGYPHTVANITSVPCPVPGLDRCNSGNFLSSHTVAVDDANPNHLYVAFAQNTVNSGTTINEDVVVTDSTDAGVTWPRSVVISSGVTARRFMPWVCSVGSAAYVSWFDRRAATGTNNSLTDYFAGTARVDAANNLVAGPERRVNAAGTQDAQCAAGRPPANAASWPGSVRANSDSDSCQPQPQLAGRCQAAGGGGSQTPCDFNSTVCPSVPSPESCVQFARGSPKYGDYNGNACMAGRFYTIWPSATTLPPTIGPAGRINLLYTSLVVAGSQIQIPGPVGLPDTCVGSSSLATANVCNTGTTDLHVDPITSSDPQFSVVTPSSGYAVTIGPGSCFPFEVRFTPTSPGSKAAILTVPSDDTVTPSVTIPVSGKATQRAIVTAIADAGDFGTVRMGAFHDQPLVLSNPGGCTLTVTGITSGIPDFQVAGVVSFPLVIAPGTSTAIAIRFQPTSFGPKATNLTINSDDPTAPARQVAVHGVGGQPTIVTSVVDTASFGKVCVGDTRDLDITITNSGTSALAISAITSSSPEFLVPQVLTFPILVAPETSVAVPIRLAPTTPGAKTTTITITSNDPVTPNKLVTMTADVPDNELCHPPSFTAVGMSIGPTFGSSKTGDWTYTGQGRNLTPFGEQHNFGVQSQGDYLYYHGRHEGQVDIGLVDRWKKVQFGVFSDFKFAEFGLVKDGGVLGQASAVADLLFSKVRVSIFGSKGFKDIGLLSTDSSVVFTSVPGPGTSADIASVEHVARVADTLGGGVLFGIGPKNDIEGNLMWLRRQKPTTLSDKAGAMARFTHHFSSRFALYGEVTLNETLVGQTNSGRVVIGFVFGRWTRPTDFSNKHTPLGTDVPRVHFDLETRPR